MLWDDESMDAAFNEGCRALGEVVYFFQQLEDDLSNAVAFLIDPDPDSNGHIVVCELSFKQLVTLAYTLFAQYIEADQSNNLIEWKAILGKAYQAENKRNALLHSTYGTNTDAEPPAFQRNKRTAKFGKGFQEAAELLDAETMTGYRVAMSGVTMELVEFMARVFPGWHDRSWSREILPD